MTIRLLIILIQLIHHEGENDLKGDYCMNEKFSYKCFEFHNKNRFVFEEVSNLGVTNGRGTFHFENDSLTLRFDQQDKTTKNIVHYIGSEQTIQDTTWYYQVLTLDYKKIILKNENGRIKLRSTK